MLLEEKQKMKKEKVLLDTWQAFMNRVFWRASMISHPTGQRPMPL
jgi:hypothetical protein